MNGKEKRMGDLISRQAAIDLVESFYKIDKSVLNIMVFKLKQLPSAEPERKKGKWEWCGNHRLCSECDEWALTVWDDNEYEEVDVLTNFCPNCGADMRGENNE